MASTHDRIMALALREAHKAGDRGNQPTGAVIVWRREVVAHGGNTADTARDPTNHAEMVAIRAACRKVKSMTLEGATLYSTMEPCPMCLWAAHRAGIKRLVLGGRHAAMKRKDLGRYSVDKLLRLTGVKMELVTGVLTRECEDLRWAWRKKTGRI
jgi:tRNA(Arg) A34 adenosine deaminase TadA